MSTITLSVMKTGQFVVNCPTAEYTCNTSVCFCGELMKTFGVMKSFQTHMVWKTPTVTRIGRISGRTTDQYTRNAPAPSIRAASKSSVGMVRMYPMMRK